MASSATFWRCFLGSEWRALQHLELFDTIYFCTWVYEAMPSINVQHMTYTKPKEVLRAFFWSIHLFIEFHFISFIFFLHCTESMRDCRSNDALHYLTVHANMFRCSRILLFTATFLYVFLFLFYVSSISFLLMFF